MIGLFLGETDFPKLIIKKLKKKKIKYLIIDLTKKKIFKNDPNSYHISIGQFGKILNLLNTKKCKKVIFAGKIDKPQINKLKLDLKGIYYIARIIKAAKKGDAAILKELIKILLENKIKVISSISFNPELTLKKGCYTKTKPSRSHIKNIKNGIKYLKKVNSYNHTQALVIDNNKIISLEKRSGTKQMLKSIRKTKDKSAILIKIPKSKQDLRADLPTIGIDTLKDCKKAGITGIAIKANQNIFLNRDKSINFANNNKIFIVAI